MKDDIHSPTKWAIGVVVAVYPDIDDVVRVVEVKVGNKIFMQSVVKLIALEAVD